MRQKKPPFTFQDFNRDFEIGDTGKDVKKLHEILAFYGYQVDAAEQENNSFGKSTLAAAEALRDNVKQNPNLLGEELFRIILQHVFQIEPEEIDPEFARGTRNKIRQYRDGEGYQFDALDAVGGGSHSIPRVVEMASQYVGQREGKNNTGALVKRFCGCEGVPWCGGFVNYVMDRAIAPGLFDQGNALGALSYRDEAQKYGAFRSKHSDYIPNAGDVIVFKRGGGGHVGIVTDIAEDGTVTYISGNDGNAVRATKFNINHPPKGLIGYADTISLAAAKGVAVNAVRIEQAPNTSVAAARYNESSYSRG